MITQVQEDVPMGAHMPNPIESKPEVQISNTPANVVMESANDNHIVPLGIKLEACPGQQVGPSGNMVADAICKPIILAVREGDQSKYMEETMKN